LQRLQTYLRSSGRYGPSPFLVGHYGGIGDISQGFCRASAVSGGVYILARKVTSITQSPLPDWLTSQDGPPTPTGGKLHFVYSLNLEDFPDTLSTNLIISSPPYVFPNLENKVRQLSPPTQAGFRRNIAVIAQCIAIIDQALALRSADVETEPVNSQDVFTDNNANVLPVPSTKDTPADTAILVFPPSSVEDGSSTHTATALINGEGNMSTPKGKCEHVFLPSIL